MIRMWRHAKEYRKDRSASMNGNNFAYIRMCAHVIVRMGMYICAQGVAPCEERYRKDRSASSMNGTTSVYIRMCVYAFWYMCVCVYMYIYIR